MNMRYLLITPAFILFATVQAQAETWWKFTSQSDANAAQVACTNLLPDDVNAATHQESPVQITSDWSLIYDDGDGTWSIPACPYTSAPVSATVIDARPPS